MAEIDNTQSLISSFDYNISTKYSVPLTYGLIFIYKYAPINMQITFGSINHAKMKHKDKIHHTGYLQSNTMSYYQICSNVEIVVLSVKNDHVAL